MRHPTAFKAITAVICVVCLGYAAYWWFQNELNSEHIAEQCEHRIEQMVDPYALQSWATNLLHTQPLGGTNFSGTFPAPASLQQIWKHRGPSVYIREASEGEEQYVYIFLGSGVLGHWGVSVGSPSFVPARPSYGSRMWKPGIYFWRDCH